MKSVLGMFAEPSGDMIHNMNHIVGKPAVNSDPSKPTLQPLSDTEKSEMLGLVAIRGREGFTDIQKARMESLIERYVANGGLDPRSVPNPSDPNVKGSSMLDLSSPVNTIVKAIFLMGISGMINGPHFFILNGFCIGAITYSLLKLNR